jgi:hypothetical protein
MQHACLVWLLVPVYPLAPPHAKPYAESGSWETSSIGVSPEPDCRQPVSRAQAHQRSKTKQPLDAVLVAHDRAPREGLAVVGEAEAPLLEDRLQHARRAAKCLIRPQFLQLLLCTRVVDWIIQHWLVVMYIYNGGERLLDNN